MERMCKLMGFLKKLYKDEAGRGHGYNSGVIAGGYCYVTAFRCKVNDIFTEVKIACILSNHPHLSVVGPVSPIFLAEVQVTIYSYTALAVAGLAAGLDLKTHKFPTAHLAPNCCGAVPLSVPQGTAILLSAQGAIRALFIIPFALGGMGAGCQADGYPGAVGKLMGVLVPFWRTLG